MSAQNAIISAWYFSLIQESSTEVSRPPEYAKTIFIRRRFNCQRTARAKEIEHSTSNQASHGRRLFGVGCWMLNVRCFYPTPFRLLSGRFDVHQYIVHSWQFPSHMVFDL